MRTFVTSYSLTGNNEALAASIAAELNAERVKITEPKTRTVGTIILDILFNRTPRVNQANEKIEDDDLVIFVGPVWMGKAATPFRAGFKLMKSRKGQYAYVSISGGALGPNPKLADELLSRMGKEPAALIDLHVADLLPPDPKPTMQDTSAYRVTDRDVKKLTGAIVDTLRETMAR